MWAKDDEREQLAGSRLYAWRRGGDSDEYPDDDGQFHYESENDGSPSPAHRDTSTDQSAENSAKKLNGKKGDQSKGILG